MSSQRLWNIRSPCRVLSHANVCKLDIERSDAVHVGGAWRADTLVAVIPALKEDVLSNASNGEFLAGRCRH